MGNVLLDVRNLRTEFVTQDGVVHAVNGVTFYLEEGETLGLVGGLVEAAEQRVRRFRQIRFDVDGHALDSDATRSDSFR